MRHLAVPLAAAAVLVISACADADPVDSGTTPTGDPSGKGDNPRSDPGALIAVTMNSTVGVLLDELPASIRDRAAANLLARPSSFWVARARRQITLTTYQLVFRQYFVSDTKNRNALPLAPPEKQEVTLNGAARRVTINGHDLVVVDYTLKTTILSDAESPGISEPTLKNVGGAKSESFTFPIDPELLFQRTRFACMDEEDFPPNSVDSEEVDSFYDQYCEPETTLSSVGQCHLTEQPTLSCVDALDAKVGKVSTSMTFTRLKWDKALADKVRVGAITNPTGADLKPIASEFRENRVVYRYIEPGSCTLVEKCVGAPGWRRLLQFSTSDINVGARALDIGAVDYYLDGVGRSLIEHGVFELSACHEHYHFMHYGSFLYGGQASTAKRGFCLQSTARYLNAEWSPLNNPYGGCDYQGVSAGWADQYKAGLECQWVDVTGYDTSKKTVTQSLSFTSNPDGFLCEGTPVLDAAGKPVYEPTSYTTLDGKPVDRPKCDFYGPWAANNGDAYDVTLPLDGNGYVTEACQYGQIGPLRNCGLKKQDNMKTCTAGQPVTKRCTVPAGAAPQVVRVCDYSVALKTGIPCTFQDARANASVLATGTDVTFTCPTARDAVEVGGAYSLYTGPVMDGDSAAVVTCQ